MENSKIRPRADPKPLNRSTQNLKQVIVFAKQFLRHISCKSVYWKFFGIWIKYENRLIY